MTDLGKARHCSGNPEERVDAAWWGSSSPPPHPPARHTQTSHHFYSSAERACQSPLEVQVKKQWPAPLFLQRASARLCHRSLPPPDKLGHFSGILLHMPSISIIRNKTVTGTQSQLAAPPPPLQPFNYKAPVELIFKPSLSAECDCFTRKLGEFLKNEEFKLPLARSSLRWSPRGPTLSSSWKLISQLWLCSAVPRLGPDMDAV